MVIKNRGLATKTQNKEGKIEVIVRSRYIMPRTEKNDKEIIGKTVKCVWKINKREMPYGVNTSHAPPPTYIYTVSYTHLDVYKRQV